VQQHIRDGVGLSGETLPSGTARAAPTGPAVGATSFSRLKFYFEDFNNMNYSEL
jgi:hypothetical protein